MPDWIINKINKLQKLIFTKLPNITILLAKYDNFAYICHIRQYQENSNIFKGEDNEAGVGKDVIANATHYLSIHKDGPFINVNCGAIPDTLIDSELFGHEKGAFTGALSQKRGGFERAHKGTILLDEIGELPPQAQLRLLRVLQDREIERVGGTKTIPLDIRIIASSNRNLEEMVRANQFREDLWFRLNNELF